MPGLGGFLFCFIVVVVVFCWVFFRSKSEKKLLS